MGKEREGGKASLWDRERERRKDGERAKVGEEWVRKGRMGLKGMVDKK